MLAFFNTGFNFIVYNELVSDYSPILILAAVPFFVELRDSEIEHLSTLICKSKKRASYFSNLHTLFYKTKS